MTTAFSAVQQNKGLSFGSAPAISDPQNKPYQAMTPVQRRWFDLIGRRAADKDWSYLGQKWDDLRWELCYLFGYTWLPSKEMAGFVHGGINLLRSTGLLVVNHFWFQRPKQEPEVGIAVRLYRCSYNEQMDELVIGGAENCCFAKNLALMPYSGAHGSIIDPDKTPTLLDKAIQVELAIQQCATPEGRKLLSNPMFPPCLLAYRMDQVPDMEPSPALTSAALRYLGLDLDSKPALKALTVIDGGEVVGLEGDNNEWRIVVRRDGKDQCFTIPAYVTLYENIARGAVLEPGSLLGHFEWPDAQQLPTSWEEAEIGLGDWAANWLLEAIWNNAAVVHQFGNQPLWCIPHTLVKGKAAFAAQKFLDLRDQLGCEYRNDDLEVEDVASDECNVRVVHMRQAACAEVMAFVSPEDRLDANLWHMPDHWAKYFRPAKPPLTQRHNDSQRRRIA